jgi:hypothetical protein
LSKNSNEEVKNIYIPLRLTPFPHSSWLMTCLGFWQKMKRSATLLIRKGGEAAQNKITLYFIFGSFDEANIT